MKRNKLFYVIILLSFMYLGCSKERVKVGSTFSKIIDLSPESQEKISDELGFYSERFKVHNVDINIKSGITSTDNTYRGSITASYIEDSE